MAELQSSVQAAACVAVGRALRKHAGTCAWLLDPGRANVGERVAVEDGEAFVETLLLASGTLACFPGSLLEDAPPLELVPGGGQTTYAAALLQFSCAALASAHSQLVCAVPDLLHEMICALHCVPPSAARAAVVNGALSSSYQDLVRVSLFFFFFSLAL